jgi:hypothetical protein
MAVHGPNLRMLNAPTLYITLPLEAECLKDGYFFFTSTAGLDSVSLSLETA